MNLPTNTTADGTAFAMTVQLPVKATHVNVLNGGGHYPCTGVIVIYELPD